MREVTGSIGPALVFRAVLAELHRNREGKPLRLSRTLRQNRDLPRERRAFLGVLPARDGVVPPGNGTRVFLPATLRNGHGRSFLGRGSNRSALSRPSPRSRPAHSRRAREVRARASRLFPKGARVEWWIDDAPFAESTGGRRTGALAPHPRPPCGEGARLGIRSGSADLDGPGLVPCEVTERPPAVTG